MSYINFDESGIRLSVHRKTPIDVIRDSIPKPEGYLPPNSLPTWETFPLEQKLPSLPAPPGALYFSRGLLGKSILRKTKTFCTHDPLNFERIPSNKYEILHDPSVKVNSNRHAVNILKDDGTVNENMEVICTAKEFNRYRKYLSTIYNDDVRRKIADAEDLKEFEKEAAKLLREQCVDDICKEKRARGEKRKAFAKARQKEKASAALQRWKEKEAYAEYRRITVEKERAHRKVMQTAINEDLRAVNAAKREAMRFDEIEKRKQLLHEVTLNDMRHAANREHLRNNRRIVHENQLAKWFDAKTVSAAERLQREKLAEADYNEELNHRAIQRQKRVEKFRAGLPARIARTLAEKERVNEIVRKYAMRWLNRVRDKKKKVVDETHESLWYTSNRNCLAESVKYLYEQSGHEKLDDVVMNILKFKQALKNQMLLDEEEQEEEEEEYEDYDEL